MGWTISKEHLQEREDIKNCVGPGWSHLLQGLFNALDMICQGDFMNEILVTQVKEKFGSLRFYIDAGTDEQFAAIHAAEHISEYTCESCGRPGHARRYGYWVTVRCDECYEEGKKKCAQASQST